VGVNPPLRWFASRGTFAAPSNHGEDVGGLSSEQPLGDNLCALLIYFLILSSRSSAHVLTKGMYFHGQGMLHGILGDNSRGFVQGTGLPMSVEPTVFCSSVGVILYVLLLQGLH
jgi:hypothetical protein